MLHEVFLSLSGYTSPLFTPGSSVTSPSATVVDPNFPLLQPAERSLLQVIGRLSFLHRNLKIHLKRISSSHHSAICRAIAIAIRDDRLAIFQHRILDVERRILSKDASIIGAYDIVPLSGIVAEFDSWPRLMEWYWSLSRFMLPLGSKIITKGCSGAELINHIRQEALTGYPEIEEAAIALGAVAERAWLRQISTWLLYGDLPVFGAEDFFVQRADNTDVFRIAEELCPVLVNEATRSSILFIGRSLNLIRKLFQSSDIQDSPSDAESIEKLVPIHSRILAGLIHPLATSVLTRSITDIRLSLSRNALAQILPLPKLVQTLKVLRDFFLLGRGEFAVALIAETDEQMRTRNKSNVSVTSTRLADGLKGMIVKDTELKAVLSRSWVTLARYGNDEEDEEDEVLEIARQLIHFEHSKPHKTRHTEARAATKGSKSVVETSFRDVLMPTPTALTLRIQSPMDLFITDADVDHYASLNAYLLSIRRAHIHLTSLWRESSLRREPLRKQRSQTAATRATAMARANVRNSQMRKVWASCSAAIFFLSELDEYLEGHVLNSAWLEFRAWIEAPLKVGALDQAASPSRVEDATADQTERPAPRDPEVLASAHRRFLSYLARVLLHTDVSFTSDLRSFIRDVDSLVAHVTRLQNIQVNLELEIDLGSSGGLVDYRREETETLRDVDRARKCIDGGLKALVRCLRTVDADREGDLGASDFDGSHSSADSRFTLQAGPRVERLLMKLEFASGKHEDQEFDDLI